MQERFSKCRGVYKVPDVSALRNYLMDHWRHLGSGTFSSAYGKGRFVWKVNTSTAGRKAAKADGAFPYLKAIVEGKIRSKHAPKVFRLIYDDRGRFAALMERLDKTVYEVAYWQFANFKYFFNTRQFVELRKLDVPESLIRFAKRVARMFVDFEADMHAYNIMTRGSEFVVIDPLSYRKEA